MVEAAALQRVVDLACAVAGDDHDRRLVGLDRAKLGNGDLEVGQHLQQVGLERLVRAIELVDQEHRRALRIGLERLEQRAPDQEALVEDASRQTGAFRAARRLGEADLQHLPLVVPFVDRRGHIQPLVALQPHQPAAERLAQHLRDLRLADAGLAFQEQGATEAQGQIEGGGQRAIGDVVAGLKQGGRRVDGGG